MEEKKEKKFVNSMTCKYIVSVLSAWNSEFATYPFDLVKTRMQIFGELGRSEAKKKSGMLATVFYIGKEEGVPKLYQGIGPGLLRHVVYSGIRMVCYDYIRTAMAIYQNDGGRLALWQSAFCGLSAGVISQGIASPIDVVKTQIQMEGKRRLMGEPPRVHGVVHAFQVLYRKGGVRGLWIGCVPNMLRSAMVNLGDLSAYDVAKQSLIRNVGFRDDIYVHIVASFIAGFVAAVLGTPADTIKIRIMNQPTDERGRGLYYKNIFDCAKKTINAEGFFGLYKGFTPLWIRLAPWAMVFWISFEQISHLIGADGF